MLSRQLLVRITALLILLGSTCALAQDAAKRPASVQAYISVEAPVVALTHVQLIDGTGAAPLDDQTLIIEGGKIKSVGSAAQTPPPPGAKVLDLAGFTVIPGLVGMHDHLFYPSGGVEGTAIYNEMGFSAPRLYLACGVTSIRTTGSIEPYTDLNLKKLIDDGKLTGPKIHVTGPYLEGAGAYTPQMHELTGAEDARRTVDFWAGQGVTSFKAYMHITRAELSAAIEEAHKHGIKVTGHLCSVGFREAAALGIDDLEHGLLVDTEFDPDKKPDFCPSQRTTAATESKLDVESAPVQETIRDLVAHHVAMTSTLPIFETFVPNRPPLSQHVLASLLPEARIAYLTERARVADGKDSPWPVIFKKEMQFERDFVKAGGLLLAGNDPTGYGGDLAGFGDLRGVELLVEAGFTPAEAIQIASSNGAKFMGESDRIGTIAPGKQADLVVIKGDPNKSIADIQNVTLVFKDGIGYDSAKMIDSVRGAVGLH
ncbi:MAG TPA: amidohydrolase family protein [Terriglobia bacterium]|nr:amidohydrolase family protein [Terriglobia bacterium]